MGSICSISTVIKDGLVSDDLRAGKSPNEMEVEWANPGNEGFSTAAFDSCRANFTSEVNGF